MFAQFKFERMPCLCVYACNVYIHMYVCIVQRDFFVYFRKVDSIWLFLEKINFQKVSQALA